MIDIKLKSSDAEIELKYPQEYNLSICELQEISDIIKEYINKDNISKIPIIVNGI
jgi:hypothetical protein